MDRKEINHTQWECQQFLYRVTALTDRCSWDELADCYTEDAVLIRPSDPDHGIHGREAIRASLKSRPPRITCHILANSVFDLESPDRVVATSRVWLLVGDSSENLPVQATRKLLVGSFVDDLVRIDNQWFLQRRRGSMELTYDYCDSME